MRRLIRNWLLGKRERLHFFKKGKVPVFVLVLPISSKTGQPLNVVPKPKIKLVR